MSENDSGASESAEAPGAVAIITDAIEGAITGVPAPVKRAAWETFKKLVTSATDIGVAKFEGYAQEIRATTAARVQLIAASGAQMAQQVDVHPTYGKAASDTYAAKILRRQINIDKTCQIAAEELNAAISLPGNKGTDTQDPHPSVSDDWINAFDAEASNMSSDQMQRHFGRILAGEISRPGTFSIRTLKIMAQLDNRAAVLFARLCSLAVCVYSNRLLDARVVVVGERAGNNGLKPYGLRYADLNLLAEYGLVITDFGTEATWDACVNNQGKLFAYLKHQNETYFLERMEVSSDSTPLKVPGVAFSSAGRELLAIVDPDPVPEFTTALNAYFESLGYKLKPSGPLEFVEESDE